MHSSMTEACYMLTAHPNPKPEAQTPNLLHGRQNAQMPKAYTFNLWICSCA